jgi:hypothetical protein
VMEDDFEWGVFQGGAVDVAGDPVVVEHWMSLLSVSILVKPRDQPMSAPGRCDTCNRPRR